MDIFGIKIKENSLMPKDTVWLAKGTSTKITDAQGEEHIVVDLNVKQNTVIRGLSNSKVEEE